MNDTTTEIEPATVSSSKQKRLTNMNAQAGTFTRDGVDYDRNTLPAHVRDYLATVGLNAMLAATAKPAELYVQYQAGSLKERSAPEYSEWHRAAASARALGQVKAGGVRAKPGKSLRDTDEFTAAYEAALLAALPWTADKTRDARKHPAVVEEHARITGGAGDLGALFSVAE